MTLCAGVLVYLIVIATLQKGEKEEERREDARRGPNVTRIHYFWLQFTAESHRVCLVSKKVNLPEFCEVNKTEAEGLVPAIGEHVEADLATNGELEPKVGEFFLQHSHKRLSHLVHLPWSWQQVSEEG